MVAGSSTDDLLQLLLTYTIVDTCTCATVDTYLLESSCICQAYLLRFIV